MIAALGSHSITATCNGDAANAGSSDSLTELVQQRSTSTMLMADQTSVALGQTINLTASVYAGMSTPTGTVTFMDGDTVLATIDLTTSMMGAQATLSISTLALGDHTITAVYNGDTADTASQCSIDVTVHA